MNEEKSTASKVISKSNSNAASKTASNAFSDAASNAFSNALTYNDIAFNNRQKQIFKNSAATSSFYRAYMICGESGTGKSMLCQSFILDLFCQNKKKNRYAEKTGIENGIRAENGYIRTDNDALPCLVCPDCKKIIAGVHPDVIYVTHDKPNTISVDDIRTKLVSTINIRPLLSGKKVYIIDEAEKMNTQAQNALLKTLEEPPSYACIILLCSDKEQILPTVLSRVICVDMDRLPDDYIAGYIKKSIKKSDNGFGDISDNMLKICSGLSGGSLGKALHFAGDKELRNILEDVLRLFKDCHDMDCAARYEAAKKLMSVPEYRSDVLDMLEYLYGSTLKNRGIDKTGKIASVIKEIEKCRERHSSNVNAEMSFFLLLEHMADADI